MIVKEATPRNLVDIVVKAHAKGKHSGETALMIQHLISKQERLIYGDAPLEFMKRVDYAVRSIKREFADSLLDAIIGRGPTTVDCAIDSSHSLDRRADVIQLFAFMNNHPDQRRYYWPEPIPQRRQSLLQRLTAWARKPLTYDGPTGYEKERTI